MVEITICLQENAKGAINMQIERRRLGDAKSGELNVGKMLHEIIDRFVTTVPGAKCLKPLDVPAQQIIPDKPEDFKMAWRKAFPGGIFIN